jgi:hypothetical protein
VRFYIDISAMFFLRDPMSYDLAVFEPTAELRDRSTFMQWYESRTTWSDGLDYSNASNATDALQSWYRDMSDTFPPSVNASIQTDPDERLWITEYAIAKDFIYAAFRWDKASMAYESVRRLAAKYKVGFFDVSGDRGGVWFPSPGERLELAHDNDDSDAGHERFARRLAAAKNQFGAVRCETMDEAVAALMRMDPTNPKVIIGPDPPKSK